VVLLRPPRYVWPFNGEASAFWQPLGLLCLAAYVRRQLPAAQVEVWDCPGQRMGWRTLEQKIRGQRIDVLGLGEETASAHEALRAAALVKGVWPHCLVVAGGVHFAHAIEETLTGTDRVAQPPSAVHGIDVVIGGEGEATFAELLTHHDNPARWGEIAGLAFRDSAGKVVVNPPRPLITNLDDLPFPAYDLVDMSRYGWGSRNHPGLVALEHSRGCVDSCGFCILWRHMGRPADGDEGVRPCYRTKSAERSFAEVERLYRDSGRRTFGWVDPTFNAAPEWSDAWADLMLRSGLMDGAGKPKTLHTAWMRADGVVRDEKLGILEKLVRAGLRQVMIGVERTDAAGLALLNKHNNDPDVCRAAFAIFRRKYPQVFTIGSVIFGLPGDTWGELRRLIDAQYDMAMDYCFLIPLTPNPGTAVAGLSADADRSRYNFHTPVAGTGALDKLQLESIYWRAMLSVNPKRLVAAAGQLLFQRDARKRRISWSLATRGAGIAVRSLISAASRRPNRQPAFYSRKPSWYES
jgi:anaerobic magnesium-protoporphyrin IX monomethyl ester cyclase